MMQNRSILRPKRAQLRMLERSMMRTKRDTVMQSQYQANQMKFQTREKQTKNLEQDISDLFELLSDGINQVDIDDLISYINSLGAQYMNSVLIKIIRIYKVFFLFPGCLEAFQIKFIECWIAKAVSEDRRFGGGFKKLVLRVDWLLLDHLFGYIFSGFKAVSGRLDFS